MAAYDREFFALCGRYINIKRQKRQFKKERDQRVIRLHRERKSISRQMWDLGYEELNPPIQRGWKREFVLTREVELSEDAAFYQALLDKINTTDYHHRRDFKIKKKRKGKKIHVERIQKLADLSEWQFRKYIKTEKEQAYFIEQWTYWKKEKISKKYVFAEPWRFKLRVFPNMMTEVKIIDPSLIQRSDEIDSFLESGNPYGRYCSLFDSTYGHDKDFLQEKYAYTMKQESVHKMTAEYFEEKQQKIR